MHMILRRLLQLAFVLIGITLVTFLLVHMVPGDPARVIVGDRATPGNACRHPRKSRARQAASAAISCRQPSRLHRYVKQAMPGPGS